MDRRSRDESMNDSSGKSGVKQRTYGGVFNKFADMTSMSGVGYIKSSKLIIARIIWSVLLFVSLGALIVHLWYSLSQFYSYPKTAKVNLGFANLRFPEITICNINPVSKRRLDSYDSASVEPLKRLVEAINPKNLAPEQFNDSMSFDDLLDIYLGDDFDYYSDFWNDYDSADFYDHYDNSEGFYEYTDEYYDESLSDYGSGDGSQSDAEIDTDDKTDHNNEADPNDGIADDKTDPNDGIDEDETDPNDGIADDQTDSDDEIDQNIKKKRRKRYTSLYDAFNFTEFDPLFEDWFRHKKDDLLSPNEYGATIDTATKIDALFRKTFMKLARWERGRLGHNITKMLLKCTFAGRKCDENKKLFRLHQTPEYGNCWTLSAPKFVAQDAGPNAGLSLVINLQSTDYLDGITHGYGARIQIHNYGAYPDPYQDGFSVPASMETSIGLKLVTFDRLSGVYGDCEDGVDFARKYKRPYTRRTCQIFCHATRIIETCGCFDDFSEEVAVKTGQGQGLTACSTVEQYDCVNRIENAFETKELSCLCRNPCSESAYTKSITNHQWPSDEHAKLLLAGICVEDSGACKSFLNENNTISGVFNNFLKLNIYYEDLNYEEIKEEADIEIAQILSDVGGAVGLWIGLSVMSFCEVIQLIIELIKLTRHKIKDNSRHSRRKYRKRKAYLDEESLRKVVPFGTQFDERKGNSNGPDAHKAGNGSTGENMFLFSNQKFPYGYNVFKP